MIGLTILGATGSIGKSTLAVIRQNPERFRVLALTANSNVTEMLAQCLEFKPCYAVMLNDGAASQLAQQLKSLNCSTEVLSGRDALCQVAALDENDMVMAAIVGAAGLMPTLAAVRAGKRILLANKEALVMSGALFMDEVKASGAELLPIDSEHNAIFQAMPVAVQNNLGFCDLIAEGISKILLTGSGGPFRYSNIADLAAVTPAQACAHPNWSMGQKISVDSATMMNKGLEYIEAKWLFNADESQIQVVIHPQSVIHSMVQYTDGSVLAQMGEPDMCTPIAHAMAYPKRIPSGVKPLDFFEMGELTFLKPDYTRYPCLKLAIDACYQGQVATTTLNATNEVAVDAFLTGQIGFTDIARVNATVLEALTFSEAKSIDALIEIDAMARIDAQQTISRVTK
ncbi:1-deoxy-D-xylulose-5-phosphate reductoisomerase [Moritella marina ATCC 15381]|uniref:1-deoxy-D-xylulose 5-phosphate reductoisomerase n=1 Tax=Moritella marina ATCC 15381 TaxID=1202962 RepID=A0A5J6WTD0_MORMI|nr:1-deoxy-D-xylulose-5-phosphate reductoisomerase [Moritella marina]QFI40070.1 1-deoxy-D-xylulose-5-phosphate reductoisomerase [Moritella marina ATCC 15381]